MTKQLSVFSVCVLLLSFWLPAQAQVMVFGDGDAYSCFQSAESGDPGRQLSIQTCKRALAAPMTRKDEAATWVNLGILLMRSEAYDEALNAYNEAIAINPDLAAAYINKGACQIYIGQYDAAVISLTKSIDLGTNRLAEAHYNRALAYERLEDFDSAYADLKKAQSLRPSWVRPQQSLEKYKIIRKGSSE